MTGHSHAVAANWLWLAGATGRDVALVLADDGAPWVSALSHHYATVEVVRASALADELARGIGATRDEQARRLTSFADGALDCVVIPGFLGAWSGVPWGMASSAARSATLRECRRLLHDGGVLYASGPNPLWRGEVEHLMTTTDYNDSPESRSPVAAPGRPPLAERVSSVRIVGGGAARAAREAGFRRVADYYAEPSDLLPRAIIPARRAAALAFERQERSLRGRTPRLLASAGLHAVIYPTRLLVGLA